MKVLKFGGSSVGSPERILKVKEIVSTTSNSIIVVSAFQGVTDQLEEICKLAATQSEEYLSQLNEIKTRHIDTVTSTISDSSHAKTIKVLEEHLLELQNILRGVFLLGDITPKVQARVLAYGELLCAWILSNVIENSTFIDSREFIKTNSDFLKAKVDFDVSNQLIQGRLLWETNIVICPGFIASDQNMLTTTLGRGGSDYTAAIIASAINSEVLEIWTDVDGFMTADPRKVSKAFAIDSLSYAEAMELSHFGAKVIYTPTIKPALLSGIPIRIKNTFAPEEKGTLISSANDNQPDSTPIKGVSSIDEIDLITMQGSGMVGVKGISSRLFGALAQADVNIILITQASSEYSITFAIAPLDTKNALNAIEQEFENEINYRKEISLMVERDLSIVAIVGEKMKNTPGISATLFSSLGRNGISVIATSQGSSELNISVVLRKIQLKKALNVIHEGFFLSHYKSLHLYIVGVGTVGSSLINQINLQQERLLNEHKLLVKVIGICRSKKMILNQDGINLDNYLEKMEQEGQAANLDNFVDTIKEFNLRNSVFIDCTAEDFVAEKYHKVLSNYISVVTANKVACSSKYENYQLLKTTAKNNNIKFRFETNVGAGLPIINTINDLTCSGDRILKMEAVLSGTLNYIFNVLSEDVPMSKAIKSAKEKGFSEPDPRLDLNGMDVKRKLLILARESGYKLEEEDIVLEPFLPEICFSGTMDDFWTEVGKLDKQFEADRKKLVLEKKRWRFIAKLDCGKASISLQAVDNNHPAYNLAGTNNIILLTTVRYNQEPMVIRGYGAGAEVTAAGIFADAIRVSNL